MKHGKTALAVSSFENYEIVYQNVDEMLRSRAARAKARVMLRNVTPGPRIFFHARSGPRVTVWVRVYVNVGVKVRVRLRNILPEIA